jgi:stress response protein YsnF
MSAAVSRKQRMPDQVDQERQPDDLRIPLHVEEVSVSRHEIEKANVQVALITGTREQLIDEQLTHIRVEIERVPIGRTIDVVPPISHEGDVTIIPVVEEIVVVERRVVLKEEVRVRRVRTKEQHQETVVLRQQEAVITREEQNSQPGPTLRPPNLPNKPEGQTHE